MIYTFYHNIFLPLFRYKSNIGYLMYVADAFGDLSSVAIFFSGTLGRAMSDRLRFFTVGVF
ncbi:DUF5690 family protein [Phaeodactylibacter xiamenensis]|uniref:DUF5690 family protein n=1 Tax=Phaeodactylibacter xiamenensis TaxID=1524460 RepID=UPI00373FDABF